MFENQGSNRHSSANSEISLHQIFYVLKKWRILILTITLLFTLGVGVLNFFVIQPVYQAKTLLMVTVASEKLQVNNQLMIRPGEDTLLENQAAMPILTMNTYLGQIQSEILMKRVLDQLGLKKQTISSLSAMIDSSIIKDSNLIEVKVSHTDPKMAKLIADTLSEEYLELMKEFMFSSVVVISPANTPVIPIKPHKVMNTALALMLALLMASALSFILEKMDNTLKTADDVNRELNLPVLGVIPGQSMPNPKTKRPGGGV